MQAVHQLMSVGDARPLNLFLRCEQLEATMQNSLTPLHCAAQNYCGLLAIICVMQSATVNVNARDCKQATPLHHAVLHCQPKNVEVLLKYGADPAAQDWQGNTPIHIAVLRSCQEPETWPDQKRIIKELLCKGGSLKMKTYQGLTPLELSY